MSTRTRTWSTTIPVDHTQIKLGPTKVRDLRTDIEERVDDILAGFVNTGTTNGLLLARLLTVGTATSANPGTGTAAAVDIIGLTTGTMTEVVIRNSSGQSCLVSYRGNLRVGQLANDEYLVGVGTTSGTVNVLKVNTAGTTQFTNLVTFDSHPLAPNTNPTTDLQLMPLGKFRNLADGTTLEVTTGTSPTMKVKGVGGVTKAALGIDSGTVSYTGTAKAITFNFNFSSAPVVVANWNTDGAGQFLYCLTITTAGYTVNGGGATGTIKWIAVGEA